MATAAANDRNYMLSFLHRHGASINKPTNEGLTPLHIATAKNNDKMVQFIIDRSGDFNGKHHGRSPIDYVDNSWQFKRVNVENMGGPITKVIYAKTEIGRSLLILALHFFEHITFVAGTVSLVK